MPFLTLIISKAMYQEMGKKLSIKSSSYYLRRISRLYKYSVHFTFMYDFFKKISNELTCTRWYHPSKHFHKDRLETFRQWSLQSRLEPLRPSRGCVSMPSWKNEKESSEIICLKKWNNQFNWTEFWEKSFIIAARIYPLIRKQKPLKE